MAHNGVGVADFVKERLLQIRGDLRIFKDLDPGKTALVAIDMQNAFLEPNGPIPVRSALEIVEPINRAAQGCRELGVPVIWIRSHHPANGGDWRHFFDHFVRPDRREAAAAHLSADAHGSQFYSEMDVQDSDYIVIKNRYSCFVPGSSSLERLLRSLGRDTIVLCGDLNVARTEMDVHPRERKPTIIGQLPESLGASLIVITRFTAARGSFCISPFGHVTRTVSTSVREPSRTTTGTPSYVTLR